MSLALLLSFAAAHASDPRNRCSTRQPLDLSQWPTSRRPSLPVRLTTTSACRSAGKPLMKAGRSASVRFAPLFCSADVTITNALADQEPRPHRRCDPRHQARRSDPPQYALQHFGERGLAASRLLELLDLAQGQPHGQVRALLCTPHFRGSSADLTVRQEVFYCNEECKAKAEHYHIECEVCCTLMLRRRSSPLEPGAEAHPSAVASVYYRPVL